LKDEKEAKQMVRRINKYWKKIQKLPPDSLKRRSEELRLFKLIRQHGLAREFPLIISTLKAFSQGKIRVNSEKQIVDAEGKPINGYNMTDDINKLVKGAYQK